MPKVSNKARDRQKRQAKIARAENAGRKVLVLNNAYQPIAQTVGARAIYLVQAGKAEAISTGDASLNSAGAEWQIPSVIRLKRYVAVPDPQAVWGNEAVLRRDKYICQYCGKQLDPHARRNSELMPTVDHIIPKHTFPNKSLASTWGNTCCACPSCNRRKGGKSMKEAGMRFFNPNFEPKRPRADFVRLTDDTNEDWKAWIKVPKH